MDSILKTQTKNSTVYSWTVIEEPFFSVILPSYNRYNMLKIAVESVVNQLYMGWELIIVDDCSTDKEYEMLDSLRTPRIKVIRNHKNLHKGGARNEGIKIAKGRFVCFLDDDDYYLPNHLEIFYNYIISNNVIEGLLFTMPIIKHSDTGEMMKKDLEAFRGNNSVAYLFHHKNGVPTPRACISSSILKNHQFNPNIKIGQDTELFMRIAAEYMIYPIYEHTVIQVRHSDNSGALKNNTGLDRLDGYKYIFGNPIVNKYIKRSLRRYMISFCYLRSADHFSYIGDKNQTLKAALKSFYYSPFDKNIKIKFVYVFYNLPFIGTLIKKMYRIIKRYK